MRIGVPEALLFQRYEEYIRTFFDNLGVETVYSGPSNREILELGIKNSVDETCLPMKIFQGHVNKLLKECDKVAVPRLMKCEYGDSICPKFAGLPELIGKGSMKDRFIFTEPMYLSAGSRLKKALIKQGSRIDIPKARMEQAFRAAEGVTFCSKQDNSPKGAEGSGTIALLGHPYNVSDRFANMDVVKKLNRLGVSVLTGEGLIREERNSSLSGLMKAPYWMFYRENLTAASALLKNGIADGIVYVSSFCCGTDSVIIEMIRNRIGDFPMLVVKLDEHTAEAGIDTRLEAFAELLERQKRRRI